MSIAIANFRTFADRCASIALTTETDFGTADGASSPVDQSDAAQSLVNVLMGLSASAANEVIVQALLEPSRNLAARTLGARMKKEIGLDGLWSAMDRHVGGIEAYLTANADGNGNVEQIAPELAQAVGLVGARYVFSPVVADMGTFAATGATTGTFTDGDAVDTTLYGPIDIRAKVINQQLGASEVTLTVTGTGWGGVAVERTITIPSASALDSYHDADAGVWLVDITNITIAGATSGDDIQIEGKLRRTIALDA